MDNLELTHLGEPVPASRPRFAKGRTYNDPKYTKYKKALIKALKEQYGFWAWDIPSAGDKARSKYLAKYRYELIVNVYRSKNTGDIDNHVKSVMDSLTQSGVIGDDSQIDKVIANKFIDKNKPRVYLALKQII